MVLKKPFLRGWFHAVAAIGAVLLTIALCWRSRADQPRFISLLIYGLSMIELYTVSALYHIGSWREPVRSKLRALDNANIFILIAGTYTPLCFNLLSGWLRPTILIIIWSLAVVGIGLATFTLHTPRWVTVSLYICMSAIYATTCAARSITPVSWPSRTPKPAGGSTGIICCSPHG